MKSVVFASIFVLAGCGDVFTSGGSVPVETDAQDEADAGDVGLSTGGSGSGGAPSNGGALGSGGAQAGGAPGAGGVPEVPEPPCCVDSDCPASIPFCSPWGTCYQGGDPYTCDYDSLCESFCVHCSGSAAGACEEKRCVCVD
jgi:hypothetical protein